MSRADIENIRKEQRNLFKIQSKIKSLNSLFSENVKNEFSKMWLDRFGTKEYNVTVSLESGCFTPKWEPIMILLVDEISGVSFDNVMKLCRCFTSDTGMIVNITYSRNYNAAELIRYTTCDEEAEEMEL